MNELAFSFGCILLLIALLGGGFQFKGIRLERKASPGTRIASACCSFIFFAVPVYSFLSEPYCPEYQADRERAQETAKQTAVAVALVTEKADPAFKKKYYLPPNSRLSVGRDPCHNDIVTASDTSSRQHAVIISSDQDVYIEDVLSTNGTYVDGKKIKAKTMLRNGAVVSLGSSQLEIQYFTSR